ncbi:1-acyl-sn-glycerol-3-phosphate acyltransferase [Sphingomonas jejuensis]|uniref:1-acyl-sn-glycerol-3-phosphate acyltransferase n=1 Tax=Sphingomonas jejuensis TaxID=904715 RepID=A0ABX0XNI4_9SPHN|nr:lysophospholipid acyltransferase family protein [Sphingomonas jejuensis]NJC34934.1 1-acyl-sn-glycerol-3-phosphate acyltransferase [Sphingomonas jejuensis]
MVNGLRALGYTLVFYTGSVVAVLWAVVLARIAPARIPSHVEGWGRFHRRVAARLLGIRAQVDGVMPSGPVIVAMKHQAMFETLEVLVLLDRPAVVMKRELADIPFFGAAVRAHGSIPISREAGPAAMRTMTAAARRALADGRPILIFPEGTRVPLGERPPLKPGFAGLYRMLQVPVVPVALDSGRLWPRSGFAKRPGIVTFRVGAPIPPGLSRAEVEARTHAAINALEDAPARA